MASLSASKATDSSEVRKTVTRRYCSAVNCKRRNFDFPELSFFRFPKEKDRCRRWVINCRRSDLLNKDTDYLFRNVRLCSLHFEDKMFLNNSRNRLHCNAIPTLFKGPYKVPLPQNKNLSKMKLPLKRSLIEAAKTKPSSAVIQIDEQVSPKSVEEKVAELCADETVEEMETTAENLKTDSDPSSRIKLRSGRRLTQSREPQPSQSTNEASSLISCDKAHEESDAKVQRLEARIQLLEQQLQQAKESQEKTLVTKENALDILKSELTEGEGFLLQSMLKSSEEEYSDQQKCFFILLYLHGPRGYEYLRQRQINIPKPSDISKWMELVGYQPVVT